MLNLDGLDLRVTPQAGARTRCCALLTMVQIDIATAVARLVATGAQLRWHRMLPLTIGSLMQTRISPIGPFLIEIEQNNYFRKQSTSTMALIIFSPLDENSIDSSGPFSFRSFY
jgi:hypothetical protein